MQQLSEMGKTGTYGNEKNRDERRSFNRTQQSKIWEKQHGKCAKCKKSLKPSSTHYDHIKPWEKGGKTVVENGQAICASCHSEKTRDDRLKTVDKKRRGKREEYNLLDIKPIKIKPFKF